MKKQSLLFVAGAMLVMASCQNEAPASGGFTQDQVDSIVNARVNEEMMKQQAANDSIINAMAAYKADSIVAAMKGTAPVAAKPHVTPTKPTKPTPPTPPAPTNPKDDRFNGTGKNNTTQKESRFDDKAAEKQKEENAKKKADRFK